MRFGLLGLSAPSKSRFILLSLEKQHLALADYPLYIREKSKRKEEIEIVNIRYIVEDKLDGISIFARCKLLDLTHLFS